MAHQISISQLGVSDLPAWLCRLATQDEVFHLMKVNPLIFASWYIVMHPLVSWPEEVQAIQERESRQKRSFEEAMALIESVRDVMQEPMSAEKATKLIEGYAVHDWFLAHPKEMRELLNAAAQLAQDFLKYNPAESSGNLEALCAALGLNEVEKALLKLSVICSLGSEIRILLETVLSSVRMHPLVLLKALLNVEGGEVSRALSTKGTLRQCRILRSAVGRSGLPLVSSVWLELLSNPDVSLFNALVKPLTAKPGSGMPAKLAPDDEQLAVQLLKNAFEPGVNLLFYGADGLEKRTTLLRILEQAQRPAFVLQEIEGAWAETPSFAYVAQRMLVAHYGLSAVLVLESPGDVLQRKPNDFMRTLFGISTDSSHIAPFDELILSTNPVLTVWTGPGADSLPEECMARFVFHAPLKRAGRAERKEQLASVLADFKLTKATTEALLKYEDVSALQLVTAQRAAELSGAATRKEKEAYMLRAVQRSLKALQRDATPKAKECVTQYSLKYVNHAGKFGPEQILKALKLRPKGSLCLYGPPGTGKTQFVEHLAHELGMPLISKKASDLLSKWVGDNEKNVSAMFQEAEAEEAILFLDEGDSFLRDRRHADKQWEVTQVNELLQHMERFSGIFVLATNLFTGLDTAALRRFTFKVEFLALSSEQRWDMFVNESGLKGRISDHSPKQREAWRKSLEQMRQLAAGDFATVKRQCMLLGETLTPDQWIEQLSVECKVKSEASGEPEIRPGFLS